MSANRPKRSGGGGREHTYTARGTTGLRLTIPKTGYRTAMYFNRYQLLRLDCGVLMRFGLFASSAMVGFYECFLGNRCIENQKDDLLQYLGRSEHLIGTRPEIVGINAPQWSQPENVDLLRLAHWDEAEICMCRVAVGPWTGVQHPEGVQEVPAEPVAVLRCTVSTQLNLVKDLYITP